MQKRKSNSGISLLELMLVLAIIAAILVAVTRYYNLTREHLRTTQATEVIKNVANASYKWVAGKSDFSDFKPDKGIGILISTELLPQAYADATTNPWHDGVVNATSDANNDLVIEIPNVPETSCRALVVKLKNSTETAICNGSGDKQTLQTTFKKP